MIHTNSRQTRQTTYMDCKVFRGQHRRLPQLKATDHCAAYPVWDLDMAARSTEKMTAPVTIVLHNRNTMLIWKAKQSGPPILLLQYLSLGTLCILQRFKLCQNYLQQFKDLQLPFSIPFSSGNRLIHSSSHTGGATKLLLWRNDHMHASKTESC